MDTHVRAAGILNIVWGALGAMIALVVFLVLGGVAGFVGVVEHGQDEALVAVSIMTLLAFVISGFILLLSVPSIIVGLGILNRRPWARIAGIVLSFLHLLNFPFGTALGIYGLWVLFNEQAQPYLGGTAPPPPVSV